MNDFLVGTAGHVDHGKTALLAALTGIDCDRLPEEKRRGITLDLGFAHLLDDDVALGFVDVPGHERFLHNALAGLGGIRLLLLVVAADEGVRPQTREHLEIAALLGIDELLVALTKIDLVDDDGADLAELEIEELLAPTRWAGAAVRRVSAATGEGVGELRAELVARARAAAPLAAGDPARLPIDRAFALHGQGVVVTGTLGRGAIATGDTLRLEPPGREVRVRSLQVHGAARERAAAGARVALRLAGVELAELERGQELVGTGGPAPARLLLARLRLLPESPPLVRPAELRLHLDAAETPALVRPLAPVRLEPGEEGLVAIRARRPLVAARGDRFVVRRLSPAATLGGGTVLDPRWRRPPRAELEARLDALAGDGDAALVAWAHAERAGGLEPAVAATRLGQDPRAVRERLEALAGAGPLVAGAGRFFHRERLAAIERRAGELLAAHFAADRLAEAMPRAELVRRLLGRRGREIAELHLARLAERGAIALDGDRVTLPGRRAELSGGETGLAARILDEYERGGLEPPSPAEVARRLAGKPAIVEGLIRHLVTRGKLVKLPAGLVFAAATLDRLVADVAATGWERFTVAEFKDRFGLSRKWAIPLLEHLDSRGATRRAGDQRIVVRRAPAPAGG